MYTHTFHIQVLKCTVLQYKHKYILKYIHFFISFSLSISLRFVAFGIGRTQIMCSQSMSVLLSPSSSASFKFIIYLLILLTGVQLIDAVCDDHHWWQQELNECIPCTRCDDSRFLVLRPCQKHSDTVCGTFDEAELELDWLKAAAVAAERKQVSLPFFLFLNS